MFKIKRGADGTIDRFKARLVAQGYSQQPGVDYNEVFAPVARYNSIQSVLAIANQLDLEVHQMDVKSAYLNGKLDEEIYMRQPDGYVDTKRLDMVYMLRKSLYRLKQSARCWNLDMDTLKSNAFIQCSADPCIYVKEEKEVLMKCFKTLSKRFEMDD